MKHAAAVAKPSHFYANLGFLISVFEKGTSCKANKTSEKKKHFYTKVICETVTVIDSHFD